MIIAPFSTPIVGIALGGPVPDGLPVVVDATRGQQIIAGKAGE
ncbi:hypothetical protein ACH4XT_02585 [Streptomyces avidinii]